MVGLRRARSHAPHHVRREGRARRSSVNGGPREDLLPKSQMRAERGRSASAAGPRAANRSRCACVAFGNELRTDDRPRSNVWATRPRDAPGHILTLPSFAAGGLPLLPPREERPGRGGPFGSNKLHSAKTSTPSPRSSSPLGAGERESAGGSGRMRLMRPCVRRRS